MKLAPQDKQTLEHIQKLDDSMERGYVNTWVLEAMKVLARQALKEECQNDNQMLSVQKKK